jgi:pyridinium-3,5-bisthiocarboxylic acid mononucleotide nickel chelatase
MGMTEEYISIMKIAYIQCSAGVSGDLLLGAWIDLGLTPQKLLGLLDSLHLPGLDLEIEKDLRCGVSGTSVHVKVDEEKNPHRTLGDIISLIESGNFSPTSTQQATSIFTMLAQAEGRVHGKPADKIHFHEVGALDAVVDVLSSVLALEHFGIEKLIASPVQVGGGSVDCRHGRFPVPAPATLHLLENVPIQTSDIDKELATPTGVAILRGLCDDFGPFPSMMPQNTGYGLGDYDLGPVPNVIRITIGQSEEQANVVEVIETHIDDMNPQFYEVLIERLFNEGALDVTLAPVQMKRNRPATHVTVLASQGSGESLAKVLINETSTLGVRISTARRICLPRKMIVVETAYGQVSIKLREGSLPRPAPEYSDCAKLAKEAQVPVESVYRAALLAYEQLKENKA